MAGRQRAGVRLVECVAVAAAAVSRARAGAAAARLTCLLGGPSGCRMFGVLRQLASLQEDDDTTGDGTMYSTDHYLYFRGIPNPPDDYQAPLGASPNT